MQNLSLDLCVSDIVRSVAFYRDVLGFTVTYSMALPDGTPIWANVHQGTVDLMISIPGPENPATPGGTGITVYLNVDQDTDIDAYYERVKSAGGTIAAEIADMPWGDRTFLVTDPDGYRLMIGKTVNEMSFEGVQVFEGEEANAQFLQPARD